MMPVFTKIDEFSMMMMTMTMMTMIMMITWKWILHFPWSRPLASRPTIPFQSFPDCKRVQSKSWRGSTLMMMVSLMVVIIKLVKNHLGQDKRTGEESMATLDSQGSRVRSWYHEKWKVSLWIVTIKLEKMESSWQNGVLMGNGFWWEMGVKGRKRMSENGLNKACICWWEWLSKPVPSAAKFSKAGWPLLYSRTPHPPHPPVRLLFVKGVKRIWLNHLNDKSTPFNKKNQMS